MYTLHILKKDNLYDAQTSEYYFEIHLDRREKMKISANSPRRFQIINNPSKFNYISLWSTSITTTSKILHNTVDDY